MTAQEFDAKLTDLESKLMRFALSLTSNKDDAKDLLQETMLKAMIYKKQFVNHVNMRAWTYTIMKNTFINNYRRIVRQNTALDASQNLFFLNLSRKVDLPPDSHYCTLEIGKLIEGLDEEFRIPFKMHIEGYKYKEISDKLGVKLGTIKSRIFFTRKKLMDSLDDFADERKKD